MILFLAIWNTHLSFSEGGSKIHLLRVVSEHPVHTGPKTLCGRHPGIGNGAVVPELESWLAGGPGEVCGTCAMTARALVRQLPSNSDKMMLRLCNKIQEVDDQLGRFSDHEGNMDGPSWWSWRRGKKGFENYCEKALMLHRRALRIWQQAKKLNETRPDV